MGRGTSRPVARGVGKLFEPPPNPGLWKMKLWLPGQNVDVARFPSGNSGHPSWFHSLRTRANFKNGLRRSRIFLLAPTMIAQIPDARRRLALLAGVVLL